MGSAAALQFALRNAPRVRSLTLCSIGAGSDLKPGEFAANIEATAAKIEASEGKKLAEILGSPPDRQRLKEKNPAEFQKFMDQAAGLSPVGLANAYRGVVKPRPPIYAYKDDVAAMKMPTLIVVGERDGPVHEAQPVPGRRDSGRAPRGPPGAGHSVNIEEPSIVNRLVAELVAAAEAKHTSR